MPIVFSIYQSIYSRAILVNTCRSRKVRVTPEIQREILCGKKSYCCLLKFCIYIVGGNRLMRLSQEFASTVNPTRNPDNGHLQK